MKSNDLIKQLQQDAHYLYHDEITSNFAISQRIKLAVDYIKQLEAQLIKSETARQKQSELLSEERSQKHEQINRMAELQKKREFYIYTPLGKLKVYSKHGKDCPADFPGVFVDLVRDAYEDMLIACVEFDSVEQKLDMKMTQKEFAEFLDISQVTVSKWESLDYDSTFTNLVSLFDKLIDRLGIDFYDFLDGIRRNMETDLTNIQ